MMPLLGTSKCCKGPTRATYDSLDQSSKEWLTGLRLRKSKSESEREEGLGTCEL